MGYNPAEMTPEKISRMVKKIQNGTPIPISTHQLGTMVALYPGEHGCCHLSKEVITLKKTSETKCDVSELIIKFRIECAQCLLKLGKLKDPKDLREAINKIYAKYNEFKAQTRSAGGDLKITKNELYLNDMNLLKDIITSSLTTSLELLKSQDLTKCRPEVSLIISDYISCLYKIISKPKNIEAIAQNIQNLAKSYETKAQSTTNV